MPKTTMRSSRLLSWGDAVMKRDGKGAKDGCHKAHNSWGGREENPRGSLIFSTYDRACKKRKTGKAEGPVRSAAHTRTMSS